MITLKNVKTLSGAVITHTVESQSSEEIECHGKLLMMPTLIDTDAFLGPISGTPTEMTAWVNRVHGYLAAGITTVFDAEPQGAHYIRGRLQQAMESLNSSNLPSRVFFFCNGDFPEDFDMIGKVKASAAGVKITLDLAKKPIAPPHTSSFERLFQIAAQDNLVVTISLNQGLGSVDEQRKVAYDSIGKAIEAAEKFSTELCLQHVRTKEELQLIRNAKERNILVYTEVAIGHLFVNADNIPKDLIVNNANVFLPSRNDQEALWDGIRDDSIELIGSAGLYGDPILMLPLFYKAIQNQKLQMDTLVETTRINPESIFRLPSNSDIVLIDTETEKSIPAPLLAKYPLLSLLNEGPMAGWPVHVIAGGQVFSF